MIHHADPKLQELQRETSVADMLEFAMKLARKLGSPNSVLADYRSRVERQARSLLIDALLASHRQRGPACEVLASLRAIDRAEGSLSEDAPEYISDHWANIMQTAIDEYDAVKEG
jgi:phytoene/squalene synthetase